MQRAVAIFACVFDFVGVGIMAIAEIFLGGQTLVAPPENIGEYAIWAVALWTVINVGAVLAFHLSAPEARRAMAMQAEMDAITDGAFEQLKQLRTQNSQQLAHDLGGRMYGELLARLTADNDRDGTPDVMQSPHQSRQRVTASPPDTDTPQIFAYTAPTVEVEARPVRVESVEDFPTRQPR